MRQNKRVQARMRAGGGAATLAKEPSATSRVISLLFALVLAVGLMPGLALPAQQAYADPGVVTCALSSADNVSPGDTVQLSFTIAGNTDGVDAVQFSEVSFDADALELVSIEPGSMIPASVPFDGYVTPPGFGIASPTVLQGDGEFAVLTFKVKEGAAPGTYQVQVAEGEDGCFVNTVIDLTYDYNPVIAPGTITVVGGEEPDDDLLHGGETVEFAGDYTLADDATGVITIDGGLEVEIAGTSWDADEGAFTGPKYSDLTIVVGDGTALTIRDMYVEMSGADGEATRCAIDFQGEGSLDIEGMVLLDRPDLYDSCAMIHVGPDASVVLDGTGTLYGYKHAAGAFIGANANESNGAITFNGGTWLIKGSKTGSLIGTDTVAGGTITVNDGAIYLKAVAQGAAIGSSRTGSAGAVVVNGGQLQIVTDFSGSAIGYGGQKQGDPGTLTVNGGSVMTAATPNAYSSWGIDSTSNTGLVVTTANITAANDYALLTFPTAAYAGQDSISVAVDGSAFYSGAPAYEWITNEQKNPTEPYTPTTLSNWLPNTSEWATDGSGSAPGSTLAGEQNLYFLLSKDSHTIAVGDDTYEYTWDAETGAFVLAGDDPQPEYDWDSTTWAGGLDFTWYDEADVKAEYHLSTPAQWEALAWICSERLADLADYETNTNGNVKAIRGTVPSAQNTFTGVQFYLDNDIDMGGVRASDGTWTSDYAYYPIGTSCASDIAAAGQTDPNGNIWYGIFSGSFDGQGHIVSNVYCERLGANYGDSQHCALFGRVGAADGTTPPDTDIVIENVAVTGWFNGGRSCAGVVGKTLSVSSGHSVKVQNCLNFADVKTNNGAKGVGGVVGALWNGGTVDNSANFGNITGTYRTANAAGVSGAAEAGTTNSYNVGMVVNTATASNSAAVALNQSSGDVVNCWALEGTAPGYPSSIVNGNRFVEPGGWMAEADMKADAFALQLAQGGGTWVFPNENDAIYGVMAAYGVSGYPVPQVFSTSEPPEPPVVLDGYKWYTEATGDEYVISDAEELAEFANIVNGTVPEAYGIAQDNFAGKTVTLAGDIALAEDGQFVEVENVTYGASGYPATGTQYVLAEDAPIWTPIGSGTATSNTDATTANAFAGTFDGAGYTISGIYTGTKDATAGNTDTVQGLFGVVSGGTVKNVTVSGCITGKIVVGGIVAHLDGGTVENCTNNAVIFADGGTTPNGGTEDGVSRGGAVGGIVGNVMDGSEITGCVNNAPVACMNTAKGGRVGGIVGLIDGAADEASIYNNGNNGAVFAYQYAGGIVGMDYSSAAPIEKCFNTGTVTGYSQGKANVGGIVAEGHSAITNCYNTGEQHVLNIKDKISQVGGIAGLLVGSPAVTNCYNTATYSGGSAWDPSTGGSNGSLVGSGYGSGEIFANCYSLEGLPGDDVQYLNVASADEMKTDAFCIALRGEGTAYNMDSDSINGGFPILAWQGGTEPVAPVGEFALVAGDSPIYVANQPGTFSVAAEGLADGETVADWAWEVCGNPTAETPKWSKSTALVGGEGDVSTLTVAKPYSAHLAKAWRCTATTSEGRVATSDAMMFTEPPAPAELTATPGQAPEFSLGETADFTVEVAGLMDGETAGYQWYYSKDGARFYKTSFEGATTDTLTTVCRSGYDTRTYHCLVTTSADRTVTSEAQGYVPESDPLTVVSGEAPEFVLGSTADFTVTVSGLEEGEAVATYQWYYSKDNGKSFNKTTFTGADTDKLTTTCKAGYDTRVYRCTIVTSDGRTAVGETQAFSNAPDAS